MADILEWRFISQMLNPVRVIYTDYLEVIIVTNSENAVK